MGADTACTEVLTETETLHPDDGEEGPRRVGEALRRARLYRRWSLRDVERRTGRPNAYLSQIERGIIRRPDPVVVWQLADLYGLNFELLMQWSGQDASKPSDPLDGPTISTLIKQIVNLDENQRVRAVALLEELAREEQT